MDFAASINQAPEAQAFLDRVAALPKQPGVSLDHVLKPSIEKEAELRRLFAQDRKNYHLLNPYVGLVSVFEAPEEAGIRLTRARIVKDQEDLSAMHVFPLPESRRRKDFEPCVVDSLEEFQRNWNIFAEGALSQLKDWNNVIAADGSVLGCLSPLSPADKESRRTIRKFYHSSAYPALDIDLFLWGLDAEQVCNSGVFECLHKD